MPAAHPTGGDRGRRRAALCGEDFESRHGDEARDAESESIKPLIDEIRPLEGARELLAELKERGHRMVLASSAKEWELEHYLDLLDAREIADAWTSSADVDATKPDPDLVEVALERAGGRPGVMVGDSVWDCEAARHAGVPAIGVRTGGFSADELREAGAEVVFESLPALCEGLDETSLPS